MLWPFLTVLALAALAAVHFWWRRKFLLAGQEAQRNIRNIKAEQEGAALQVQTRQDALFNSMVEGLLLLDEDGRIQLANRAFASLFEVTTDMRGKLFLEVLRLHQLAELVRVLGTERIVSGYELRLAGSGERWVQVNGAAIFNGNGQRRGTILVFHELTRIKQLERTRQEFVANVSHELRTPLSLIKGYVETLLEGAKDHPELATRFLKTIEKHTDRLTFLIEDLL